jgi:hypothetical protein
VVCYRAGHRSHFFFTLRIRHGRRSEPKAFSWLQYRDLIVMIHLQLGTPVVWCWDNLNVYLVRELADFAAADREVATGAARSAGSQPKNFSSSAARASGCSSAMKWPLSSMPL